MVIPLFYEEDDMEAMKGDLDLSLDNILWNSYFYIKSNCIDVVTPAPTMF